MNALVAITSDFFQFLTTKLLSQPEHAAALHGIQLSLNTDPQKQQFGDLSTNAPLVLAKVLGRSPREIATEISQNFTHPSIAKIEIAGPGFINFFLTPETFAELAQALATEQASFFKKVDSLEPTLSYSVEFVSANPTGPLHLGHGRGGIIGDTLARILRFRGHKVTTEFYINDAGAQILKLGLSFKARCLQQLGVDAPIPEEGYFGEYLVELAKEYTKNKSVEDLQKTSDIAFADYAKAQLLALLKKTLAHYGILFDVWFSEKSLHDSGAIEKAIALVEKRGHLVERDGALWFVSTAFGDDKDRVVRKANGELTYLASDIAYLENKLERGFDKLVMVLGQDHHSYLTRLKAMMQALGHNPDDLDVILYQLVTIKESGEVMRLSKRKGRIVSLEDVIETVGPDVARFFYLNRKADAHLEFDIELALKHTEENPVFYLQYAFVRTKSILEKASTIAGLENISVADAQQLGESERLLLKKIVSLNDVLASMSRTYQTHLLASYTIELAQEFHKYYAAHRVINQEDLATSRGRLLATTLVRATLKTCLELLGLSTPEKM
jgi:arginyl-tRNA synthetase